MEQCTFGSSQRQVSVIGQGTCYDENRDPASAIAALRLGLDRGMKHIETAEMYGSGAAEKLVGKAIAWRRDEVFLVPKVLPQNAGRQKAIRACERSLLRLKTNRLDCYLLHWRGQHPLDETVAAFEQLRDQEKILSWGVSNFDIDDLEEFWSVAGEGRLACNQVLYHLQERAIEHAVIPWCQQHKVVVYSPLGHGAFPGPHAQGGRVSHEVAQLQISSCLQQTSPASTTPSPWARFPTGFPLCRFVRQLNECVHSFVAATTFGNPRFVQQLWTT